MPGALAEWADKAWYWAVVIVFLALAAWESARPRAEHARSVPLRWATNFGLYAVNASLLAILVAALAGNTLAGRWGLTQRPLLGLADVIGDWPTLAVGVLALDLYAYLIHRVQHSVQLLWRFHA